MSYHPNTINPDNDSVHLLKVDTSVTKSDKMEISFDFWHDWSVPVDGWYLFGSN